MSGYTSTVYKVGGYVIMILSIDTQRQTVDQSMKSVFQVVEVFVTIIDGQLHFNGVQNRRLCYNDFNAKTKVLHAL